MTPLEILYIEDDPDDVILLQDHLHPDRHRVRYCGTLKEGLQVLSGNHTDLVLLDLNLPDANGIETVVQVRKQYPHTPILVFSGIDNDEVGIMAVENGAQGYLVKGDAHMGMLDRVLRDAIFMKRHQDRQHAFTRFVQDFLDVQRRVHHLDAPVSDLPLRMCQVVYEHLRIPFIRWTEVVAPGHYAIHQVRCIDNSPNSLVYNSRRIAPLDRAAIDSIDPVRIQFSSHRSDIGFIDPEYIAGFSVATCRTIDSAGTVRILSVPVPEDFKPFPEVEKLVRGLAEDLDEALRQATLQADALEAKKVITRSLREKEVLLREVHHRVKNNLQLIMSLLNLGISRFSDPDVSVAMQECEQKIFSIALAHEHMYESEDVTSIELRPYLATLTTQNADLFGRIGDIAVAIECDPIFVPLDLAVPIGLITSELVTNAYKHAFPAGRTGTITIIARKTIDNRVTLIVADDGVGLQDRFQDEKSTHFGIVLVQSLVQQLEGTIETSGSPGTSTVITFTMEKTSE